jgi:hypothetical protein
MMDPRKIMKLLTALIKVKRLCGELGLPDAINQEAARACVAECIKGGPPELHQAVIEAFGGSQTIQ